MLWCRQKSSSTKSKKLDEELDDYTNLLENKVEEYQKLLSLITPFSDYLGWDMSRALWQETSFDVIQQYQELLQDETELQELADFIGRHAGSGDRNGRRKRFAKTIIRQEWVTDEFTPAEVVGIHESSDLNPLTQFGSSIVERSGAGVAFFQKNGGSKSADL